MAQGWPVVEKLCAAEPTVGWKVIHKTLLRLAGFK